MAKAIKRNSFDLYYRNKEKFKQDKKLKYLCTSFLGLGSVEEYIEREKQISEFYKGNTLWGDNSITKILFGNGAIVSSDEDGWFENDKYIFKATMK